ncbi:HupE/UreJ family protein [Rhizobium grahamii]|uniref:HupE/UreJ protein n=1 Tax=Rhizobium grahamii CCGE 502 TaxID=990285 RepID=S3H9T8_9HYPH|nr:HupE/UreJ family protein [Rhizobium grahamii]EPE94975.1 HupE/UreJ protein [Rhizobium grahamii CCGE 502]
MFSKTKRFNIALAACVLVPSLAFAHPGDGQTLGFFHGFVHPVAGLDHVLAMVLVGILAWQLGGRALFAVPTAFVSLMALGGALGAAKISVPFVETGIALSVIVLGAAIAIEIWMPVALATGAVGLFAVFHGHAHGLEMPEAAGRIAYAAGFLVATAILHGLGILVGWLIGKATERHGKIVTRAGGSIAALAGFGLLTGLI